MSLKIINHLFNILAHIEHFIFVWLFINPQRWQFINWSWDLLLFKVSFSIFFLIRLSGLLLFASFLYFMHCKSLHLLLELLLHAMHVNSNNLFCMIILFLLWSGEFEPLKKLVFKNQESGSALGHSATVLPNSKFTRMFLSDSLKP